MRPSTYGKWRSRSFRISNFGDGRLKAPAGQSAIEIRNPEIRMDRLNIAMFSAEVFPFVKVGGLADVGGALAKALEVLGMRVVIVLPAFKAIDHDRFAMRPYKSIPDFPVPMGAGSSRAEIYHARMAGTSIDAFLIGSGDYFYRDGIYDDPLTKEGYHDNMQRFMFFMKAGLELVRRLGRPVDVIHCHDWQTALIPGMLRTNLDRDPFFGRIGTLFTIHNLAYQGIYPKESLYWAGIDYRHFFPASPFEFWGKVNFMKAGIEFADLFTTVSENYAREIQSGPEFGHGLEGIIRRRRQDLWGIVNGIDHAEWDPARDPLIPKPFCAENLKGKKACKAAVLSAFGLRPLPGDVPLVGIVSRLAEQKGFDLLGDSIEEIAGLDLQIVVLGQGQQKYHDLFRQMARRYPEKIATRFEFDNRLSHLVIAGSDMLLMPSKFEPCGLNQLYSLRYGTVPVVRAVGGLVDTVENYDFAKGTGTGFSFNHYSSHELIIALMRALLVYAKPERWRALMLRGMGQDWSWERSARKYLELYQRIYRKRNSEPG
jgi:starch synthase